MRALQTDDRRSNSAFEWLGAPQLEAEKPRYLMEHRWGNRHAANMPVDFMLPTGLRGAGRVLNISTTGAYLETAMPLRILTLIDLFVHGVPPPRARFPACVIRHDDAGVGLEWQAPIRRDLMETALLVWDR